MPDRPKTGDTFAAYYGEFLVSPVPLELSFSYCSHKCAYCIEADSPVMGIDLRTKPGRDVVIGDVLLGFAPTVDGSYRKWAPAVVEEVFSRKAPCVRAYLENGETVVCTPDHHFYTGRLGAIEYAPLTRPSGKVRSGRKLHRVRLPLLPRAPFTPDYMLGYIRGAIEGDASTTPYGAWRLALADNEILARVASFAILLGWGHYDVRPHKAYHDRPGYQPMQQLYFPVDSPVARFVNSGEDKDTAEYWRGWAAGIYDAEGNTPARRNNAQKQSLRIAQVREVNPETYGRIVSVVDRLGFKAVCEDRAVRLVGSDADSARFVQLIQPATPRKQNPLIGATLKGVQDRVPVVRVEPAGDVEVASFRTSTHNYVSGGLLSRNCFANLNKPGRWADTKATLNLIAQHRQRKTLEASLLTMGYPTLISNRVDPFAVSNDRQAIPVMEVMAASGLPIAIQTRGGRAADEVLAFLPPSCWYVSIPMLNDVTRKRVEPGAPPIPERLDLIQKLTEQGHHVCLAVNPLFEDWLPEPAPLLEEAYRRGARGVWMEQPHLSHRQASRLTPRETAALGTFIPEAKKKRGVLYDAHLADARETAKEIGYHLYTGGQHERSGYFDAYHATYTHTFPTMQGWINHLHDALPEGGVVSLDDYLGYFVPRLLPGVWPVQPYIGVTSKDVVRDSPMPNQGTYAGLLTKAWGDPRVKFNPARGRGFAYAGERDGKDWVRLTDDDGTPLMVFSPQGRCVRYFIEPEAA